MSKEIIKIEEPNLVAFIDKIEQYVKDGYSVEDTNSGVPSQFGWGLYVCEVSKEVKDSVKSEPEATTQETTEKTEPEPAKTTTAKPKSTGSKSTTRKKSTKSSTDEE